MPWIKTTLANRWFKHLTNFGFKPAIAATVAWYLLRVFPVFDLPSGALFGGLFVLANLIINSGPWRWFEEVTVELAVQSWRGVRYHVLPGLFEIVMAFFAKMIELMERAIYTVDEWLRLRSGDGKIAFGFKLMLNLPGLSALSHPVYINLLVEPQVNPIKHFPVVTVSHKIILPFTKVLIVAFAAPIVPIFGQVIGNTIATATVVLLPGVFGFLVWEFKSNWFLYEANHGSGFKTAIIGDHSERCFAS